MQYAASLFGKGILMEWGSCSDESGVVQGVGAARDPGGGGCRRRRSRGRARSSSAVKATGLNFFDTLIIAGKYQYKPDHPFSPGAEVSPAS
jgi:hypothetical protein